MEKEKVTTNVEELKREDVEMKDDGSNREHKVSSEITGYSLGVIE